MSPKRTEHNLDEQKGETISWNRKKKKKHTDARSAAGRPGRGKKKEFGRIVPTACQESMRKMKRDSSACRLCGEMTSDPMSEDDSPVKILSIASKPLSEPPFPVERLEELTRMMGGRGDVGGYYHEQRK